MEHTTEIETTHTCGSRPVPFEGTQDEATDNFNSHHFRYDYDNDEVRCVKCDCKDWHQAARYPCGDEPPRERYGLCHACDLELPVVELTEFVI